MLGEFADVYKGTLQTPKGKEIVAIKVLRVSVILGYYFLAQKFMHSIDCEYQFDPYLSNVWLSKSKVPNFQDLPNLEGESILTNIFKSLLGIKLRVLKCVVFFLVLLARL